VKSRRQRGSELQESIETLQRTERGSGSALERAKVTLRILFELRSQTIRLLVFSEPD
jgi:hypothetical protein